MPPANDSTCTAKKEEEQPEEDINLGPGMFDEDAAEMLNVAPATKPKTLEDLMGPWGGYGTSKKKNTKIKSASRVPNTTLIAVCLAKCETSRCVHVTFCKHE